MLYDGISSLDVLQSPFFKYLITFTKEKTISNKNSQHLHKFVKADALLNEHSNARLLSYGNSTINFT